MQRSHQKLHIVFWKPECWSFIFAHSQHMAVTIHWLFRNMYGHSFMPLYIHVSDATAYNTLNTLKIVASHGRWQKLVSADSPILSLYLYKRSGAKSHLAMGLDTLLWLTQLELGWDLMDLPTSAKLWFCDRLSPQTGGDYTTSLSVFDHPQWKEMCFLMFRYILFCARCLSSYQQTLLKSVLLPLLHSPLFRYLYTMRSLWFWFFCSPIWTAPAPSPSSEMLRSLISLSLQDQAASHTPPMSAAPASTIRWRLSSHWRSCICSLLSLPHLLLPSSFPLHQALQFPCRNFISLLTTHSVPQIWVPQM